MKTQTKIALIFFSFVSAAILLLSGGIYFFIMKYSFGDFYKRLEIRAVVVARTTLDHETADVSVLQEVRALHLERLPEEKEYFFKIEADRDFDQEASQLSVPTSFFKDVVALGGATHKNDNTFFAGIRYTGKGGDYVVIVSADNYNNISFLGHLRNLFLFGVAISTLLTFLLSVLFARRVFGPVKRITKQVQEISSRSLHLRLDPADQMDEIGELSRTFNNMLDRLETAFATQNNFVSNASHELNTPLTAIIGQAEVTLARERSPEEYTQSLEVILSKAERLHDITRSLLYLAQTGFTGKLESSNLVRADELLWDLKEMIDKLHPNNKVQLNFSLMPENPEKLRINGNDRLLLIAISNVVTNAIKYSGNQEVVVSIGTSEDHVFIVVKDKGIGIPDEDLQYIYDPFFRAGNTFDYAGYGIGLPLTRNILRLHRGEILVSSKVNVGTTVQLTLPADFEVQ